MRQAEKMIMYKSDSAKPSAHPPHHMIHSPSLSASGGALSKRSDNNWTNFNYNTTLGLVAEASVLSKAVPIKRT